MRSCTSAVSTAFVGGTAMANGGRKARSGRRGCTPSQAFFIRGAVLVRGGGEWWSGARGAVTPAAENISGLDRPVVAERHQDAQHIAERACRPGAPRNELGR